MIRTIKRLLRQAFPGFPEHYVARLGEVVAIADPPAAEQGTDRFRPRYAVDVQPFTPAGEPDPDAPVLCGLPLPVTAAGQGRGIYGFPDIGARVLYAFAYGLPPDSARMDNTAPAWAIRMPRSWPAMTAQRRQSRRAARAAACCSSSRAASSSWRALNSAWASGTARCARGITPWASPSPTVSRSR
jgi:hypothetical protein